MDLPGSGKRPRAALYCRVSTRDQNPDLQLHELRQVAQQRGWHVVGVFVDRGVSGTKDRRPELDRLMQAAHRGLDVVACWRFDRFARSTRHLVTALEDFRERNIDFVSIRDGIDTSTIVGRFTFTVIAAVSALEVELIRERTIAGLAAARRRNVKLGRRPVPVDLAVARRHRDEGASMREISRRMGIAAATIQRALQTADQSPLH